METESASLRGLWRLSGSASVSHFFLHCSALKKNEVFFFFREMYELRMYHVRQGHPVSDGKESHVLSHVESICVYKCEEMYMRVL